jgi:hypothetical protein
LFLYLINSIEKFANVIAKPPLLGAQSPFEKASPKEASTMYRHSLLHLNHSPDFLGLFGVVENGTEGISHATGISIATYPTIFACI